ncbi:MAG: hypothetical protein JWM96_664 [Alphaproteobacteria bacterium]|nr:hypothetical protein [Alphaproteobacteria bacterium]
MIIPPFTLKPISFYIQPYYNRWTQPETKGDQIIDEFREMLAADFSKFHPSGYEMNHFEDADDRDFEYERSYFKHKENPRIQAIIFKRDFLCDATPYTQKVETYYRLYDISPTIYHENYQILGHFRNLGECLTHPVPNIAPYVTVAQNGLVMLRPLQARESMKLTCLADEQDKLKM